MLMTHSRIPRAGYLLRFSSFDLVQAIPHLRRRSRRSPMLSCLFVGVGESNHPGVSVWPPQERDPRRQIVPSKSGRHDDRWYIHEKGIDVRGALLVDIRGIDAVSDQRWLVLDRLVDDGVQPMIGHDLQHVGH